MRASTLSKLLLCSLLILARSTHATTETTVPITAELGTSIAQDLFPVTVKLTPGNLFLTEPLLLFLDQDRIGMQVRFQAYDHRPAQGIAISEMGRAAFSGKVGFDPATRQILLHEPRLDKLEFDRKNEVTRRLLTQIQAAWSAQVTDPIRAEIPPHPYILPFKNNIQNLTYDGKIINLTISY